MKNGHTLPVGGPSGSGSRGIESVRPTLDLQFRINERRGRDPSDAERRAMTSQDGGWRGGRAAVDEWKPNMAWQGEEIKHGGRLHTDAERKPGLIKAPSEDGRRTRPEADWKPCLPRHSSAEEGRGRRGEVNFPFLPLTLWFPLLCSCSPVFPPLLSSLGHAEVESGAAPSGPALAKILI